MKGAKQHSTHKMAKPKCGMWTYAFQLAFILSCPTWDFYYKCLSSLVKLTFVCKCKKLAFLSGEKVCFYLHCLPHACNPMIRNSKGSMNSVNAFLLSPILWHVLLPFVMGQILAILIWAVSGKHVIHNYESRKPRRRLFIYHHLSTTLGTLGDGLEYFKNSLRKKIMLALSRLWLEIWGSNTPSKQIIIAIYIMAL